MSRNLPRLAPRLLARTVSDPTISARHLLQRVVTNDERLIPFYRDLYEAYRVHFDQRANSSADHSPFVEMS